MKLDVFFYEAFEEEQLAIQRHLPKTIQAGFTWKTIQESADASPPAAIISTRTQSQLPSSWAGRLTGILTRSTGYDHVRDYLRQVEKQIDEFDTKRIACGYLPLYCNRAVAEQAMMLWMALLRKLPRQLQQFSKFNRDGLTGRECLSKTLLVVGVGNIGYEAVKIGLALGMNALGVDIVRRHEDVEYVEIDAGMACADVIVCAMNLTDDNAAYFDYARLCGGSPEAIFVNVARGEHSPAADLLRLLEQGLLGGVGLDVYDREKEFAVQLRSGDTAQGDADRDGAFAALLALADRPDVITTPHNAFNTIEAVERKSAQAVESIAAMLETGGFTWPVPTD